MNNTVKIIIFLTFICLSNIFVYGQNSETVMSKLQKKVWVLQNSGDAKITEKYVSNHIFYTVNGKQSRKAEFYLSNQKDTVYNSDKKESEVNGKYIISRIVRDESDKRPKPITILEIIEISDNRLLLKNLNNSLIEYKAE